MGGRGTFLAFLTFLPYETTFAIHIWNSNMLSIMMRRCVCEVFVCGRGGGGIEGGRDRGRDWGEGLRGGIKGKEGGRVERKGRGAKKHLLVLYTVGILWTQHAQMGTRIPGILTGKHNLSATQSLVSSLIVHCNRQQHSYLIHSVTIPNMVQFATQDGGLLRTLQILVQMYRQWNNILA